MSADFLMIRHCVNGTSMRVFAEDVFVTFEFQTMCSHFVGVVVIFVFHKKLSPLRAFTTISNLYYCQNDKLLCDRRQLECFAWHTYLNIYVTRVSYAKTTHNIQNFTFDLFLISRRGKKRIQFVMLLCIGLSSGSETRQLLHKQYIRHHIRAVSKLANGQIAATFPTPHRHTPTSSHVIELD